MFVEKKKTTTFVGVNTHDNLLVNRKVLNTIAQRLPSEVYPEYFLIRVNDFDKVAVSPLEEWIKYLKDGTISSETKAPGLKEALHKLQYYEMSQADRNDHDAHLNDMRITNDTIDSAKFEGRAEGIEIGKAEGIAEGETKNDASSVFISTSRLVSTLTVG